MQTLLEKKESYSPIASSKKRFDFNIARPKLVAWLELISFIYLGFPLLLFALNWMRLPYAILLSLTLIGGIGWEWYKSKQYYDQLTRDRVSRPNEEPISWLQVLGIICLGILWGCHSGAGGFAVTNVDWLKHFAVLKDLTLYDWPVVYQIPESAEPVPLLYYIGYYLPAALLGKLLGWKAACVTLLVYTIIGVVLSLLWFALAVGRRFVLAVCIFTFLGGLDFFGNRLASGRPLENGLYDFLPWWMGPRSWQYPVNWNLLVFVPHHMIGGWVATGLLVNSSLEKRSLSHVGLLIGLTLLWSPFVFIGLLPFGMFLILHSRFRGVFSITNILIASMLGIFLFPYFIAHRVPLIRFWSVTNWRLSWNQVALFLLIEVGFYLMFCRELRKPSDPLLKIWAVVCTLCLLLIPLYHIGDWNDFNMRVSIPALYVLWIFVVRELMRKRWSIETRILAMFVLMGSFVGLHEFARQAGTFPARPPEIRFVHHMFDRNAIPVDQYLGNYRAFFFEKIMKDSKAQSVIEAK